MSYFQCQSFLRFLFVGLLSLTILIFSTESLADDMASTLNRLPIQSGGRVKPFGTFARESLQLIYGRSHYSAKAASEVVFTWILMPSHWSGVDIIEIPRLDLKQNLKLNETQKYFSVNVISASPRLSLILQELQNKKDNKIKLNNYFQAVERLEAQLRTFVAITSGQALALLPQKDTETWKNFSQFNQNEKAKFQVLAKTFIQSIDSQDVSSLQEAVDDFIVFAKAQNPSHYPSLTPIDVELHYNSLSPFKWAWVLYLIGAIFFLTVLLGWQWGRYPGFLTLMLAFLLHTYGFILRIYLMERPPVSNMYESVIWVAWGAVFFALLFELWQRRIYYVFSACVVACLCLITADMAPTVLDPSLQPLMSVLNSNLWLIVHVMTITLGYSAFFLSFVLSNIGLGYFFKDPQKNPKLFQTNVLSLTNATYYAMQVGVVLLAAGTVLGGIWADYSWGRFWDWDPKEVWALVALLGYIAVVHGRLAGWLGPFGFLAWGSICFSLILMAWYGVNFVLGAGLHSYGFGGGGLEYVSSFVILHLIYVVTITATRHSYQRGYSSHSK